MDFIILDAGQKEKYKGEIMEMMQISDREFVPPLSSRTSTLQKDLTGGSPSEAGIAAYYEEMNKQQILGAFEEGELLGIVSFRENFTNEIISDRELPNLYISTLILRPEARGKKLTACMYEYLFDEVYSDRSIFTRTWSTNMAHIKILSRFGFQELRRKKNDRGEGIDTVYYKKIPTLS